MGIPVKYSTVSVEKTIKSNSVVFGVDPSDYGPTSSTGFYAGVDPPPSGYTIYIVGGPSGINARCAENDNDAILIAREYGGTNINTIEDAIVYFITGSTGTTIVNMTYPNIVTSGLTVNLDPRSTTSYPRKGTILRDLSGYGNNATLVNNPVWSSEYDGIIITNNTDNSVMNMGKDLIGLAHNIHYDLNYSIEMWVNIITMGHFKFLYGAYNGSTLQRGGSIWLSNGSGGYINHTFHFSNSLFIGGVGQPDILNCQGLWKQWVITSEDSYYYKFYLNGKLKGSSTYNWRDSANREDVTSTNNYGFGGETVSGSVIDAKYGPCRIYNRTLSNSEILQNYYAIAISDDIVTNGLSHYLDAGNFYSYISGSTIFQDLSGNHLNGTLTGTTSFNTANSGSFAFDGSSQILIPNLTPFSGTQPHTYCAWVKPSNLALQYNWIINNGSDSQGDSIIIRYKNVAYFYSGGAAVVSGTQEMTAGYWYYIVVVKYGTADVDLYLDGEFDINRTSSASFSAVNTNPQLGSWYNNVHPFYGNLAITQIYNRALSSAEILQNYNATMSRFYGSELLTNGTFDTSTGWSLAESSIISGGTLNVSTTSNSQCIHAVSITYQRWYRIEFDMVSYTSGTPFMSLGVGESAMISSPSVLGRKIMYAQAGNYDSNLRVYGGIQNVGGISSYDNISIREVL